MALNLFEIFATLTLDKTDFDKGIDGAKKEAQGLGGIFAGSESAITKMASAMQVASAVGNTLVGVIKGVASAGLSLVETSASLKALEESYASAFGNIGASAEAAFNRIGEANNIAMLRLQQSGISFFRQFTSAGMDAESALSSMEQMLGFAADAAAAYDMSLEDASAMMRSFVRGNVEAGESIGLFITQTKRDELAAAMFQGKGWDDLTEAERQLALMEQIRLSYAASNVTGQGVIERDNWSNVTGNLSSAWTGAMAIMGDELREALIPALQDLTKWINENPEIFESIGEVIGDIATALVSLFQNLLDFVGKNGPQIVAFFETLSGIFSGGEPKPEATEDEKRTAAKAFLTGTTNAANPYEYAAGIIGEDSKEWLNVYDAFLKNGYVSEDAATKLVDSAFSDLQSELDKQTLTVQVEPTFGDVFNNAANFLFGWLNPGSNAKGLDYVPYDNYPSYLHRGESVLSRVEAESWRASRNGGVTSDPVAIGDAVKAALAGVTISMDGRSVGTLVTPYVSEQQAAEAWRRR